MSVFGCRLMKQLGLIYMCDLIVVIEAELSKAS